MSEAVVVALIAGGLEIIGLIVVAIINNKTMKTELEKSSQLADARLEKAQAITDTKLEELTREVREHNNFARRMPVLEEKVATIEKKIG